MEIIYIMIYFIGPGLLAEHIKDQLKIVGDEKKKGMTIYENLFIVVFTSAVSFVSTLILLNIVYKMLCKDEIIMVDEFLSKSNDFKFIILFLTIETIIAFIIKFWIQDKITKFFFDRRNKKAKERYNTKQDYIDDKNVWESLFYAKKEYLLVTIWKDGKFITAGFISGWNSGRNERKELLLERTKEVKELIDSNDNSELKKELDYPEHEYIDMETGILIKFYAPEKIVEHWNKN